MCVQMRQTVAVYLVIYLDRPGECLDYPRHSLNIARIGGSFVSIQIVKFHGVTPKHEAAVAAHRGI